MARLLGFRSLRRMVGQGHLYEQRYKSFPLQDDEHFFVAFRYVERNALRAELVDRAEDWRWGSLWRWRQRPEPEPKLLSPWPLARLPDWIDRLKGRTWGQSTFAARSSH